MQDSGERWSAQGYKITSKVGGQTSWASRHTVHDSSVYVFGLAERKRDGPVLSGLLSMGYNWKNGFESQTMPGSKQAFDDLLWVIQRVIKKKWSFLPWFIDLYAENM